MKKIFRMTMLLAMMAAACVSMGSCSSDDADGTFSEQRVEEYITGYKWYLDHNKRSEFRFYRNRLVTCMSGSGSITSGSLTWAESNFFGTWAVADGKLVTTFTTGAYEGFDWNSILYGSLTINKIQKDYHEIETTAPNGDAHSLGSYMVSYGKSNDFVDYSDNSDHDGALIGTWWTTAYTTDGTAAKFTMTVGKKGKVRFTAPKIDIDNTTTCTTKNGHVAFDIYLTQGTGSRSYIYVRKKNEIVFYNEDNAQSAWVWQKVE
uniref:hypothetical protein n=1 Tax=Prevotella sp. TaxID=59823 RepID=UPI0040285DF7